MGTEELTPVGGRFKGATEVAKKEFTNNDIFRYLANELGARLRDMKGATQAEKWAETLRFIQEDAPALYNFHAKREGFKDTKLRMDSKQGKEALFRGVFVQEAMDPLKNYLVPKLNGEGNAVEALDEVLAVRMKGAEYQKVIGVMKTGPQMSVLTDAERTMEFPYLRASLRTVLTGKDGAAKADAIINSLGAHAEILDQSIATGYINAAEWPKFGVRSVTGKALDSIASARLFAIFDVPARVYASFKFKSFSSEEIADYMKQYREKAESIVGFYNYEVGMAARSLGRVAIKSLPWVVGLGLLYGGYRFFSSGDEDEKVQTGKATPVIVKELAPLPGIHNSLTNEVGVGSRRRRESVFKDRGGEEYARQITTQVRELIPNEKEQERAFQMIRRFIDQNSLQKNPEAVLALVGVIVELQKIKKPIEELLPVALRIFQYYLPAAYMNITKDVAAYLAKNPRANPADVVSEPDRFFPNKYTKQMTPAWKERPFEVFVTMGFNVNEPYVKNACALIRQYFRREDWEKVASAMAEFYKNRENEASNILPAMGDTPVVPGTYALHLALLSMLIYSSTKPGANLEGNARGMSLDLGMDTLRLFAKNVNQATQWGGDEKGQRTPVPIWQLAGVQLLALKPTADTLDEKLGMVLSANPSWRIQGSTLGQGKDTTALIFSLVGAESKVKLNEKQQRAFTNALTNVFDPDRQLEAANAIIPTINNKMSEEELAEAVNGYGFEVKAGWRTGNWNVYMDRELSDYFPKGAWEKDRVASTLHGLATHEQYLAAREALILFADKYEKKNGAEPSPAVLLGASEKIVESVRKAEGEPDTEKISEQVLTPEKKKRR